MILTSYRRWLGFLAEHYPADLLKPPAKRITPERLRAFIEQLSNEVRPTTVAMAAAHLHTVARLIAPASDWRWLGLLKARLASWGKPQDRFERLVPPWYTLDFGIEMMKEAATLPSTGKERDLYYRDGLLIALISAWPIRRRGMPHSPSLATSSSTLLA